MQIEVTDELAAALRKFAKQCCRGNQDPLKTLVSLLDNAEKACENSSQLESRKYVGR